MQHNNSYQSVSLKRGINAVYQPNERNAYECGPDLAKKPDYGYQYQVAVSSNYPTNSQQYNSPSYPSEIAGQWSQPTYKADWGQQMFQNEENLQTPWLPTFQSPVLQPVTHLPDNLNIVCTIPGRLSMHGNFKFDISLAEIKRRLAAPETMNQSMLASYMRKAKSRESGEFVVKMLFDNGISLSQGRRKSIKTTKMTALVEKEALQLVVDHNKHVNRFFVTAKDSIFYEKLLRTRSFDELKLQENAAAMVAQEAQFLSQLLKLDTTLVWHNIIDPLAQAQFAASIGWLETATQKSMLNFAMLSHCFGNAFMVHGWEVLSSVFNEWSVAFADPKAFINKIQRAPPQILTLMTYGVGAPLTIGHSMPMQFHNKPSNTDNQETFVYKENMPPPCSSITELQGRPMPVARTVINQQLAALNSAARTNYQIPSQDVTPSHKAILEKVTGRLSLLNASKYNVTYAEINRRMRSPERLNQSALNSILRKAKGKEDGLDLTHKLSERELSLSIGRRKTVTDTVFSCLVEGEGQDFVKDFKSLTEKHWISKEIAYECLRRICTQDDLINNKKVVNASIEMMKKLFETLDLIKSPVGSAQSDIIRPLHPETHKAFDIFSSATHGFGLPALRVTWDAFYQTLLNRKKALEDPIGYCIEIKRPVPETVQTLLGAYQMV